MTGSPYFPAPATVRYAPRSDGAMDTLRLRCPAGLKVCLDREAKEAGVTLTYFCREGLRRFADEHHAERTMGLMPLPVRFDSEQLATLEAAASRSGLSLTTWVGHALLAAAAEAAPAETTREAEAA